MLEFIPGRRFPSANAVLDALFQPDPIELKPMPPATAALPNQETDLQESEVETCWPNVNRSDLASAETVLSPPSQPPSLPTPSGDPGGAAHRPQATLNPMFVAQCQQELAYFIGPIARLVIDEAITQHSPASLQQLVDLLMQEIPDPQAALEFRRRLLS
jgi:hypothetical protein